jgi:hypothetical protein
MRSDVAYLALVSRASTARDTVLEVLRRVNPYYGAERSLCPPSDSNCSGIFGEALSHTAGLPGAISRRLHVNRPLELLKRELS